MKCGMLIGYVTTKTKKGILRRKATYFLSRVHRQVFNYEQNQDCDEWETCDGNIKVTITARDEPDWGCTMAVLDIVYECDKCKSIHFNELPSTAEELSNFLTDLIATSDESLVVPIINKRKQQKEQSEKWTEQALKKMSKDVRNKKRI